MEEIVQILMKRDGVTKEEAVSTVRAVIEMMEVCNYDLMECEEIFMSELGLEPDYIPSLLFI